MATDEAYEAAIQRTPTYCGPAFRDELTRVARSGLKNAGNGLFAHVPLQRNMPLYQYTGKLVPLATADGYPNAYQYKCPLNPSQVLDASQEICSPAKFVNRNSKRDCNCKFVHTAEGHVVLITTRDIAAGEELFAPYAKQGYRPPTWPNTFLGCAEKEQDEFAEYLHEIPNSADARQAKSALRLLFGGPYREAKSCCQSQADLLKTLQQDPKPEVEGVQQEVRIPSLYRTEQYWIAMLQKADKMIGDGCVLEAEADHKLSLKLQMDDMKAEAWRENSLTQQNVDKMISAGSRLEDRALLGLTLVKELEELLQT